VEKARMMRMRRRMRRRKRRRKRRSVFTKSKRVAYWIRIVVVLVVL
jgi:cell division protein FtsL